MAYLNQFELAKIGFKYLGQNVKISAKASIYNADQIEIRDNSRVDDFCLLSGKITIGRFVHITAYCNLAGGEKGIIIEDLSTLAYGVHIFTQSDDYSGKTMTNSTIPKKYKNETKTTIYIRRHTIVGAGSIIMPGVELREGTSVGAMSLVRKSTEEWSIYVGNPAKKIKNRSRELLELEKEFEKDYLQRIKPLNY
jgi:acetyltransferase-like isoleucine patch superfamily enzyme